MASVAVVVAALTQAGVIPVAAGSVPAAPPCQPCDGSFQADVRSALTKLSDGMTDMRERLARLEGPTR